MIRSKISGVGHYVPQTIVTNNELEKFMDTSDEWIRERTGIQERRFFEEGVDTVSKMAFKASLVALERAELEPKDVEFIIFATLSPDYNFPGSGVLLQRELDLAEIPALDVRAQCSGFLYALSVADQYIRTGTYKTILIACSEIQSNVMEISDRGRNMAVIFGDGAAAAVLQKSEDDNRGVLSTHVHADGRFAEELMLEHPGSNPKRRITHEMVDNGSLLPYMNGKLVFKHAVIRFPEVITEALDYNDLSINDLDLLIPHQANLRISEAIQKTLRLAPEKVYNNIQKFGNTTAASIPLALSEVWEQGRLGENTLVCMAAFGSGFTWGSALVRW